MHKHTTLTLYMSCEVHLCFWVTDSIWHVYICVVLIISHTEVTTWYMRGKIT